MIVLSDPDTNGLLQPDAPPGARATRAMRATERGIRGRGIEKKKDMARQGAWAQ